MKKRSTKQLINAELAARAYNSKAKSILKMLMPTKEQESTMLIDFNCECADQNCVERVPLTLKQYEEIHKDNARFVIAAGHEEPRVEEVKSRRADFSIVEKPALKT